VVDRRSRNSISSALAVRAFITCAVLGAFALLSACGGSSHSSGGGTGGGSANNVQPIAVDGGPVAG
jgi:hypothetical protein